MYVPTGLIINFEEGTTAQRLQQTDGRRGKVATSSQSQQLASGSTAEDRADRQQDNAGHPPPKKMPKLFVNYHRGVTTSETTAAEQFGKYLAGDEVASATDCLQFWEHNRSAYDTTRASGATHISSNSIKCSRRKNF